LFGKTIRIGSADGKSTGNECEVENAGGKQDVDDGQGHGFGTGLR
jgi:hypothetical protein